MYKSPGSEDSEPARFSPNAGAPRQPVLNAPAVVTGAVLAMVFAFLALRLLPQSAAAAIEWSGAVSPARFLKDASSVSRGPGAMVTLATHMLFHSSLAHIALNSVWLLAFGAPVARRLGEHPAGVMAFLALLVASGVVGALVFIAAHPSSTTLLIGASGGVSGLLGGLVRFAFARPGDRLAANGLAPLASRPVLVWSAAVVLLNAVVGVFGWAFGLGDVDIAWEAHIGGFLFGLAAFPGVLAAARGGARAG